MNTHIPRQWLRIITSTIAASLVLFFVQTPHSLARPSTATGPVLTVDAAADNYPINPEIYGMNFADSSLVTELNLPVNRWGGNSTTRYNYNNDVSNHASDWYFENIRQGDGADPKNDSAINQFIAHNNDFNTKTLVTVPTIGYVSNDHDIDNRIQYYCGFDTIKYGPQTETDYWRGTCGNGILASNGDNVVNDPLDTSIVVGPDFVQDWIDYLHTQFSASAPQYYALDNEPDLWNDTHRDVHPAPMGYDNMRDMAYAYGAAIKAADPDAKVFGPVSWGWTGYFWSALDAAPGGTWWENPEDRLAHGNMEFIAWYLQQMADYENTDGTRILDYLDIHFYTQALYTHDPAVALGKVGNATTKAARLRSTRSLWDSGYLEQSDGSWIQEPVMLIPRMHAWVDTYYSGTKLALTEYNWGGLEDINGAVAQADVLGIFGRERLDLATIWGPPGPNEPGAYAFRMYLNYDGSGGKFGDTNVQASSTNQGKLAIYGSKDTRTGALKLMVINKTGSALTSSINLSNFRPASSAVTYTYSAANLRKIVPSTQKVAGSSFSASFPANSITLLVIPAIAPPDLSTPARNGVTPVTRPKFTWRGVKGATGYFIQLADNPDFNDPIFNDEPAPKPTFTPPSALDYQTYYWRVKAGFAAGQTEYSQPAKFDLTLLKTPGNSQVINSSKPKFTWAKVKNVTTYHIQVAGNAGFLDAPIDQDVDAASLASPVTLDPGLYYWHVKTPTSVYTPTWAFYVTPAKTPKNGQALATTLPKLTWGKMPDALQYQVHIDDGESPVDISTGLTSTTPPSALSYGNYSWCIKVDTGGGFAGDCTPPLSFEVTFLKKPANGAFLAKMPVFQWAKVPGAKRYHLEVFAGTAPGGVSFLIHDGTALSFKPTSPLPRGPNYWQVTTDTGKTSPIRSFIVGP